MMQLGMSGLVIWGMIFFIFWDKKIKKVHSKTEKSSYLNGGKRKKKALLSENNGAKLSLPKRVR